MQADERARSGGLLALPGLESDRFLRGIKGTVESQWKAVWIPALRLAWEWIRGPLSDPKPRDRLPQRWQHWEDDLLAPLLMKEPDTIQFNSYGEVIAETIPQEG